MSLKFSRNAGRVQPTPPVCKKPPIPQPPSTPLESVAAAVHWHGYTYTGTLLNFTAVLTLHRVSDPLHHTYEGAVTNGPLTMSVIARYDADWLHVLADIEPIIFGVGQGATLAYGPTEPPPQIATAILNDWTPTPPYTKIQLALRG
jgi:hypothetical protein